MGRGLIGPLWWVPGDSPLKQSGALSPLQTAGRNSKLARQPSIELPSMAVASTKSRWETGEVQAQSSSKGPSCKVGPLPGQAGLLWRGKSETTWLGRGWAEEHWGL